MRLYKIFSILEFLIFVFFILLTLSIVFFYYNNSSFNIKGIKALKSKDFLTAKKYFAQNVESGLLDNRSYLNLALSYDLLKKHLKALEIYKVVSSSNDKNMAVFFSYFNQAELHGRLGNLEKALQYYQLALEFRQKEKEIKTNIELLFSKKNQKEQKGKKGSEGENLENKEQSSGSEESQSGEDKKEEQSLENKEKDEEQNQKEKEKQKELGEEDQSKANEGQPEENENKNKNKSSEGQAEQNQAKGDDTSQSKKIDQKGLTDREQKAILDEVQKQENNVRTRFYQNKRSFGDKTGKDW